jgi:hypothetical protein
MRKTAEKDSKKRKAKQHAKQHTQWAAAESLQRKRVKDDGW